MKYEIRMKKLLSPAVALSFLLMPSCSVDDATSEDREGPVISADDPFYEAHEIVFDKDSFDNIGHSESSYDHVESVIEGQVDGKWLIHLTISDYDGRKDILELYDDDGNLTSSFNVRDVIDEHEDEIPEMGLFPVKTIICDDGIVFCHINGTRTTVSRDLKSLIDFTVPDSPADELMYYQGTVSFDGFMIEKYWVSGQLNSTVLNVTAQDGSSITIDLRDKFPRDAAEPYEVIPYHEVDMTYLLVITKAGFFKADPYTGAVYKISDDTFSFLDGYDLSGLSYTDEGILLVDMDGIKTVDFESSSVTDYLPFDCCNLNRVRAGQLELYYSDGSTVVLKTKNDWTNIDSLPRIITLTKCDVNPNAGKRILTCGGTITEDIFDSIVAFNETDEECFIVPDNRYYLDDYITASYGDDDIDTVVMDRFNADKTLSDRLAIDLMSGDGPDLFFGADTYPQLLSNSLFCDMNGLIDDTDGLWMNILQVSYSTDGSLYYVPLSFELDSMLTGPCNFGNDHDSITFDDYSAFRSEVLNGSNPVSNDRIGFITRILPSILGYVIDDDGNVDFNCEAFISLCEYAHDHINDAPITYYSGLNDSGAEVIPISSIGDYLEYSSYMSIDPTEAQILSLPSFDGTGIMLRPNGDSVSVSRINSDMDGSVRFVNYLLSYDSQIDHGSREATRDDRGRNLINIRAFEDNARMAIEAYNEECDYYIRMMGDAAQYAEVPCIKVDDQIIERYEGVISNVVLKGSIDPSISIIVYEEIQAYLEDQKSLVEVIKIINNRAQLVMDERGW